MLPLSPLLDAWLSANKAWRAQTPCAEVGLIRGEALGLLKTLPAQSVDLVLTDPPYFIDSLDEEWNEAKIQKRRAAAKTVGTLPVGMKFDPEQGKRLQAFLEPVFIECCRVLKPGGFLVSFSQARLYHRVGMAAENAGFEIRDMLGWVYEGQAKAFSQEHFVRKMNQLSAKEKAALIDALGGRKTPQLKPMIEPMVFAQKTKDGTFIQNWMRHGVGLMDTSNRFDDKFPGNLMACKKPNAAEKGVDTDHLTVKPLKVLDHLVRLLTQEGAVVLDPFAGSASTLVAAANAHRHAVGCEKSPAHFKQAVKRLKAQLRP